LNTGALTLNNEANDTLVVLGSLTASAPSSVTASGLIQTAGEITIGSPLTMTASVTLSTAGDNAGGLSGAGYGIAVTGGITAAANSTLTLNAGSGSITLAGTVASSGGTPTLQVVIADSQTGATGFNGNLSLKSLTTGTGSYDLSITGASNTITDALTFRNTGLLQLGDSAGDTVTFNGGFTAAVPNAIRLAGNVIASGPVSIGDSDSAITLLAATTINTSAGSTISSSALSLGGAVSGSGVSLTLNAGLGVATTAEIGSTGARLGAVTVIANEFNPTANIYGQSTLTIKPYTSGTAMIVGGVNNVSGSLDITQAELAYFVNGFSAITFGSSTTGSITVPNALTFSDPVTFDTNGSASIYIGADIAGIDNASITLSDPVRITAPGVRVSATNQSIRFESTLDGTDPNVESLIVSPGSSTALFAGAVGSLASLDYLTLMYDGDFTFSSPVNVKTITTGATGTTIIDTNSIVTSGVQIYNNPVRIKTSTTLTSTNSDITFNSTVDSYDGASARTLTINTGTTGHGYV
jgi:hypothetical protein